MKIGITIPNKYDEYITKIANVNHLSKTAICGLIVENFITFNKNRNMFPIFKQEVKIVFQKTPEQKLEEEQYSVVEEDPEPMDVILEKLKNSEDPEEEDPDGLPF